MSNALQILNNYDDKKYNVLVPVQTMQDFPDIYKMAINTVKLNLAEDSYEQNGKRAINKNGLEKLMSAANIQVLESRQIIPSTVQYAAEMAKQLGQPVDYDKRDIAYKVTISVPDLTGTVRVVTATKEMIASEIHDECIANARTKKKTDEAGEKEFLQIMKFRNALCESKALNRAIRKALSIKSVYTAAELNKPFAVPIVVPNTEDPDMKKAMVDRYRIGAGVLYGVDLGSGSDQSSMIAAPQQYDALVAPDTDVEDYDFDESPDDEQEEYGIVCCEDCGCEIEDFTNKKNNQTMTADEIIDYSNREFEQDLCAKCINKREKERSK